MTKALSLRMSTLSLTTMVWTVLTVLSMCVLNSCSGKYSKPEDTARSLAGMCGINASHVPIALRDHGATETIRYDPTNRAFVGFLKLELETLRRYAWHLEMKVLLPQFASTTLIMSATR